jgi:hypothetical protein
MWMTAAPACSQRTPASTISAAVIGTCGVFLRVGSDPVTAAVMTSFSISISLSHQMIMNLFILGTLGTSFYLCDL